MTLPLGTVGRKVRASEYNAIVTQVNSLTDPNWTTYSPTWSASSAPSIGNGTLTGRYRRAAGSDLVIVEIIQTWGSTTTNGTGLWRWGLPVAASTSAAGVTAGSGWILNASDIRYPLSAYLVDASFIGVMAPPFANSATTVNSRGGDVGAGTPFTLATNDIVAITLQYEAA